MSNVDKTISESIKKFSSLINEVAQAAGAAARAEVMAQFSKVLGTTRSQSKAAAVPAEGKRKVGRPRKNPLPEFFAAPSVAKPKQKAKKKEVATVKSTSNIIRQSLIMVCHCINAELSTSASRCNRCND